MPSSQPAAGDFVVRLRLRNTWREGSSAALAAEHTPLFSKGSSSISLRELKTMPHTILASTSKRVNTRKYLDCVQPFKGRRDNPKPTRKGVKIKEQEGSGKLLRFSPNTTATRWRNVSNNGSSMPCIDNMRSAWKPIRGWYRKDDPQRQPSNRKRKIEERKNHLERSLLRTNRTKRICYCLHIIGPT